jgi:single-strand DNA-binding protein
MNICTFIGRLGRDPDMRYTTSGKAVVSFSLGVNRDGKKDETDWINFVAWEKTAEVIAKYCHKGDLIGVTGSLQQRSWEKDGQKHTVHEVRVNRIDFCGGGKKNDGGASAPVADEEGFVPITEEDGELPF